MSFNLSLNPIFYALVSLALLIAVDINLDAILDATLNAPLPELANAETVTADPPSAAAYYSFFEAPPWITLFLDIYPILVTSLF